MQAEKSAVARLGRRASQILPRSWTLAVLPPRAEEIVSESPVPTAVEGTGSVGGRHVEAAVDEMMRAVMPTPRRTGTSKLAHSSGVVGTPRLTWPTISVVDAGQVAVGATSSYLPFDLVVAPSPSREDVGGRSRVSAGTKSLRRKQLDS